MQSVSELGYMGIGISDVDAWRDTATGLMGFEFFQGDDKNTYYMRWDQFHHRIKATVNGSDDLEYLGWEVPDRKALEAIAQQLEDGGVKVTWGTKDEADDRRVFELIKFTDPSGIPEEVFFGRPINQQAFYPSRPISGFKTGNMGMGHTVVYQRNLEEARHFYQDLLGLKITDYSTIPMPGGSRQMLFMHCNPRHHSIAFFETPPLPKKVNHLMVELNSLDDVGTARDICLADEIPITVELGRHHNDRMFSFYLANPSSWWFEYGWDGRQLGPDHKPERFETAKSIWGHPQLGSAASMAARNERMAPVPPNPQHG
ncbi:MAG TPA: VOC family protein [Dehalococcoidia bacterium]|nr:VOC family protein [Dehalococcoidia bacterium]